VGRMAVRTCGGVVVARGDREAMNAGSIAFDRMRKRNLMIGEKYRVCMAGTARGRLILLGDWRYSIRGGNEFVDAPMTCFTGRASRITRFSRGAVRAGKEVFHFSGMAGAAHLRQQGRRCARVMRGAVAVRTALGAEHGMNARRNTDCFAGMARCAIHFFDARRMREAVDIRMARGAGQDGMNAGLMPGWIDVDAVSRRGFQIRLRVAEQALGIGIRRGAGLRARERRQQKPERHGERAHREPEFHSLRHF